MSKLALLPIMLLLNLLWLPKAQAACTVDSSVLAFGSFSPLASDTVDSTGTISVTCIESMPYTISLSTGGSGTYSPRSMADGGNYLEYNLYTDAGYSQIWGDGTGGSSTVGSGPALLGTRDHTVYGRIPISTQRDAKVGTYGDHITVTISY